MSHEPPRLITTIGFPGSPHTPVLLIAPPNFQACCFQAEPTLPGFCVDLPPFFCTGFTGVPQGPDTVCPVDCDEPVPGACCLADGGCVETDSDNCESPDFFIAGGSCVPDPCAQPNCWFVGAECCPGKGAVAFVQVRCDLALLLGGLFGVGPVFYIQVPGLGCYCFDTSGPTIDDLIHHEAFPVLTDLYAECEAECCLAIGEPCPPPSQEYCSKCTSVHIGLIQGGYTFVVPGCGTGVQIGTTAELICEPDNQTWFGIIPAGGQGGLGPGLVAPSGNQIDSSYRLGCDGIFDFPVPQVFDSWVVRLEATDDQCPGPPWTLSVQVRGSRELEDYPNGIDITEIVSDANENVDSFFIEFPWNVVCQ